MEQQTLKVGIVSCSGEDLCEGTISRLAARKVLEELRPGRTVTICLPLFLAGGEGERAFARTYPTITLDGCAKACAKKGTEIHSGPVGAALNVSALLAEAGHRTSGEVSSRRLTDDDRAAIALVAEHTAAQVDRLGRPAVQTLAVDDMVDSHPAGKVATASLGIDGRRVDIPALPAILERMALAGLPVDAACGKRLLAVVKIYHPIVPAEEDSFGAALVAAYQAYLAGRPSEGAAP